MFSEGKSVPLALFSFSCLFLICSFMAAPAFGREISLQQHKILNFLQWEGDFLSWHREGVACWVEDPEGNLRCEIMLGGLDGYPDNLERLLEWNALNGWTVISVQTGGGTFSRWNEQWQELPSSMDVWLRVLVAQYSEMLDLPSLVRDISPGGRSLALPLFESTSELPRVKRVQLPPLSHDGLSTPETAIGYRNRMAQRGQGRGGGQSILNIAGTATGSDEMRITSSHQPGTLKVKGRQSIPAEFNHEEVFLPWWPLSESIRLKFK